MSCIYGLWVLACWLSVDAEFTFCSAFWKFPAIKTQKNILAAEKQAYYSLLNILFLSAAKGKKKSPSPR